MIKRKKRGERSDVKREEKMIDEYHSEKRNKISCTVKKKLFHNTK
jgi:hypothetical protein